MINSWLGALKGFFFFFFFKREKILDKNKEVKVVKHYKLIDESIKDKSKM